MKNNLDKITNFARLVKTSVSETQFAASDAAMTAGNSLKTAASMTAKSAKNASDATVQIAGSFARAANAQVTRIAEHTVEAVRRVESKHEGISEQVSDIAKATRVIAGVATVGAVVAAPTGMAALGVAVGIASAPIVVTAAPILVAVAGAAATVSAATHLYSKARLKRLSGPPENDHS